MIFPHLYHLQTKWQLVASVGRHCPVKYPVLHRLISLILHPNGRVIRMGRSRGSFRYSSNPSPTDFYVHKNIARCLFSRSKHFEHLEKHLPLQGAGFLSGVGKPDEPTVYVSPKRGLCRATAKSKIYMQEKRNKTGRNPKPDPAVFRYTVRFNEEEHNRFLSMFEKSGVYARSVFIKAHFFGKPFKVLTVDKTLVDYYTKLSDFHAQFRAIGTNYNQVVKELRCHFSEKKAMALLYKLERQTIELVRLSREIVELSRKMEAQWSQKSV